MGTEPTVISALEASERVIREAGRALSSREIALSIIKSGQTNLGGKTPWKTVNARLSVDIVRNGLNSRFKRTHHGLFGLREWADETEFTVKPRRIKPINELIRVVPRQRFLSYISSVPKEGLIDLDYFPLVEMSIKLPRSEAELTDEYVQLISTFVILKGNTLLSYVRTKRLPEARLHNSRSISFGGHILFDDDPTLFASDTKLRRDFLFRELYEEVSFNTPFETDYLGLLYLVSNQFERQHSGLVFLIEIPTESEVTSLEPGMHADVHFVPVTELLSNREELDSWTRRLIEVVNVRI
jgi:predicted NUDIX family phosphoesterase